MPRGVLYTRTCQRISFGPIPSVMSRGFALTMQPVLSGCASNSPNIGARRAVVIERVRKELSEPLQILAEARPTAIYARAPHPPMDREIESVKSPRSRGRKLIDGGFDGKCCWAAWRAAWILALGGETGIRTLDKPFEPILP